jgi:hypothetical protein
MILETAFGLSLFVPTDVIGAELSRPMFFSRGLSRRSIEQRVAVFGNVWHDGPMPTRLKVDGFKNLVGVDVRFGPFTCIAGANGVGKSNLFDAIRFLSLTSYYPLLEAAQRVRDDAGHNNDVRGLFHRVGSSLAGPQFAAFPPDKARPPRFHRVPPKSGIEINYPKLPTHVCVEYQCWSRVRSCQSHTMPAVKRRIQLRVGRLKEYPRPSGSIL